MLGRRLHCSSLVIAVIKCSSDVTGAEGSDIEEDLSQLGLGQCHSMSEEIKNGIMNKFYSLNKCEKRERKAIKWYSNSNRNKKKSLRETSNSKNNEQITTTTNNKNSQRNKNREINRNIFKLYPNYMKRYRKVNTDV